MSIFKQFPFSSHCRSGDLRGQGEHHQSLLPGVLHAVCQGPDPDQTSPSCIWRQLPRWESFAFERMLVRSTHINTNIVPLTWAWDNISIPLTHQDTPSLLGNSAVISQKVSPKKWFAAAINISVDVNTKMKSPEYLCYYWSGNAISTGVPLSFSPKTIYLVSVHLRFRGRRSKRPQASGFGKKA